MDLYITHKSAYCHWRSTSAIYNPSEPTNIRRVRNEVYRAQDLDPSKLRTLNVGDYPLDVLFSSEKMRHYSSSLKGHLMSQVMPQGSFRFLDEGVYMVSPELAFAQAASELSYEHLIEFGLEMCGTYCMVPNDTRGFVYRDPLTSADSIRRYIDRLPAGFCPKDARKAAKWLIDGSASPKESQLTMLLMLPYRDGGYAFGKPMLNYEIAIDADGRALAGHGGYRCDLYWPERRVAVEYDSDMFHTGAERIASDARRRNMLDYMGTTVVTVTHAQLMSFSDFAGIAKQLSRHLGKRLRMEQPVFNERHRHLRNQLFKERPFIPDSF